MTSLSLLKQLSLNSELYHDPLASLHWDELNLQDFWLPPTSLSLAGVPEFDAQEEDIKRRLSQYEFVNFVQAGIWLEGLFIERLGKSLRHTRSLTEYAYQLHEIREEAGHSLMFLKLMEKSGLHIPTHFFQKPWLMNLIGRHAPIDSRLFWLAVMIGEEVPDRMNRYVRTIAAEINPLIREMCRLHVIDEARHIGRARSELEQHLAHASPLTRKLFSAWARRLITQLTQSFYLPRAEIYELVGLTPGDQWHARALRNPTRLKFVTQMMQPTRNLLSRYGLQVSPD